MKIFHSKLKLKKLEILSEYLLVTQKFFKIRQKHYKYLLCIWVKNISTYTLPYVCVWHMNILDFLMNTVTVTSLQLLFMLNLQTFATKNVRLYGRSRKFT